MKLALAPIFMKVDYWNKYYINPYSYGVGLAVMNFFTTYFNDCKCRTDVNTRKIATKHDEQKHV